MLEPLLPYVPYLALLVRVVVGGSMMIHGRPKLDRANREKSIANFGAKGVPPIAVKLTAILEFFGGLFLVIGLLVPIVALFFVLEFAGIIVTKKTKDHAQYIAPGKPNFELDTFYLLTSVVLIVLGAGALSVDGLLGL